MSADRLDEIFRFGPIAAMRLEGFQTEEGEARETESTSS